MVAPSVYAAVRLAVGSGESVEDKPLDCGPSDRLGPERSRLVHYAGDKVLVIKTLSGELRAVSGVCTHQGCSVRFVPAATGGEIACNCHESRFGLDGQNLGGPASVPLQEYRVQDLGGRLVLGPRMND